MTEIDDGWSLRTAISTPRKNRELLRLHRSLKLRIAFDIDPAGEGTKVKNESVKDVRSAFLNRDLDLLNAYYDHLSESSGTRFVTLAMTAYRGLPEAARSGKFDRSHVKTLRRVWLTLREHDMESALDDRDVLISLTRSVFQYPDRAKEIMTLVMERGTPDGDVTPLVESLMDSGVLQEGVL